MKGEFYCAALETGSTAGAAAILQLANDVGIYVRDVVLPVSLRNLRPGRNQRAAGMFSWVLCDSHGDEIVGSGETVAAILRSHHKNSVRIVKNNFIGTPEVASINAGTSRN